MAENSIGVLHAKNKMAVGHAKSIITQSVVRLNQYAIAKKRNEAPEIYTEHYFCSWGTGLMQRRGLRIAFGRIIRNSNRLQKRISGSARSIWLF